VAAKQAASLRGEERQAAALCRWLRPVVSPDVPAALAAPQAERAAPLPQERRSRARAVVPPVAASPDAAAPQHCRPGAEAAAQYHRMSPAALPAERSAARLERVQCQARPGAGPVPRPAGAWRQAPRLVVASPGAARQVAAPPAEKSERHSPVSGMTEPAAPAVRHPVEAR
jgi:hypothetical protein